MKEKIKVSALFSLVAAFAFGVLTLNAANMTLTGEVSDAMCGAKHPIKDAVACTKACVGKGSDYALVVKGKAYTLKASDKEKADLDKLAGKMATITGDVSGTTITVASVKMAAAH
ncbi:MAG: hypothetical protein DMG49_15785 [Acidobacteria bacterium]|nr:MAG: hypothetical protein DMG49_15785 [Acidobacteriota bacterium]